MRFPHIKAARSNQLPFGPGWFSPAGCHRDAWPFPEPDQLFKAVPPLCEQPVSAPVEEAASRRCVLCEEPCREEPVNHDEPAGKPDADFMIICRSCARMCEELLMPEL